MELHQLKAFLVIARTGNLTLAAKELVASQPAVSAQLKALEDELGVALFERSHRGMKLTPAGRLLTGKAAEVCERASELSALAASLSREVPTVCKVGLNTTAGVLRIPQVLAKLRQAMPQLRIDLHQGLSHTILNDIAQEKLDAGYFFGMCDKPGLAFETLAQIELAIVAPTAWRQQLRGVPLQEVFSASWILPPEDCIFFAKTLQLLGPSHAGSPRGVIADDEATVLHLVRERVGVALLPAFLVEDEEAVFLLHRTSLQVELGLAWRHVGVEATPVRAFRAAAAEVFA